MIRYGGPADYPGNVLRTPWSPAVTSPEFRRLVRSSVSADVVGGEGAVHGESDRTTSPEGRLEAVLFLAKEPLGRRRLAQLAGVPDSFQVRDLVARLNRIYDEEGFSLRIVNVAGGYQLVTRAVFAPWLRRLHGAQAEVRLSPSAMETLAVVACCQPVLRTGVEAIRGVQCGEILRQLMDRDLVRIVGRSEELGRPFYYGTTRKFLQIFGLRSLDDLPSVDRRDPEDGSQEKPDSSEQSDQERSGEFPEGEESDGISHEGERI
ncbi:MAG: SMC-Scp complex subunit ScpB [Planctomycetia bacterium]|nr:SMC-Scp complex subunit ScpB [Planctomycetia bacterium]